MADPIDARLPAHDWTGSRIRVAGPPTLAERLAPLEARIAELAAKDLASTDRIGKLNARIKALKAQLREARQDLATKTARVTELELADLGGAVMRSAFAPPLDGPHPHERDIGQFRGPSGVLWRRHRGVYLPHMGDARTREIVEELGSSPSATSGELARASTPSAATKPEARRW